MNHDDFECDGCGVMVTGDDSHCVVFCHQTFADTDTFRDHRTGSVLSGTRRCMVPDEMAVLGWWADGSSCWRRGE